MRLTSVFVLLSITVLSISVACSNSGSDLTTEARITVENGGELRAPDGSFVLSVPPGAVSEDVDIAFKQVSSEDAPTGIPGAEGNGYELTPDGLQFSEPAHVTLTIPIDELEIDAETQLATAFDLYTVDSDGAVTAIDNPENQFDLAEGVLTLTADISHFSKLFRSKRNISISLSQIQGALAIGQKVFVEGVVSSNGTSISHDTGWVFEALSNVELDVPNTRVLHREESATLTQELSFTGNSKRFSGDVDLRPNQGVEFHSNLICTSVGTGIYSFSVVATPVITGSSGANPRPVRISLTAKVSCITVTDAEATAAASIQATLRAGGADTIFTPTAQPFGFVPTQTPTPLPTPALEPTVAATATPTPRPGPTPTQGPVAVPGEITLRVIANSGELVPDELAVFTGFELPQVSSNTGALFGFDDTGGRGIWRFIQDSNGGAALVAFAQSYSPPEPGQYAFLESQAFVMNEAGSLAFIGRLRTDIDFTDGLFLINQDGSLVEVALEGADAPGTEAKFTQFDTVQFTGNGQVLFRSPAGGNGFWIWGGQGLRHVITEGDALPGLSSGWRSTGSNRMFSPGVADDGSVLFFLARYRRAIPGGTEEVRDGGIWLLGPGGNKSVAQIGMAAPDLTTFTKILDSSINAAGRIAFSADSELEIGTQIISNRAIWKTDASGGFVKVAEPGIKVGTDNTELLEVSSPIIQHDRSVVFVGTAFDSSNSLISFLLRGSDSGIEVLARTDALPGPNGTISVVPLTINSHAVNRGGAVAFTVGFGDQVWLRTSDGAVQRIIAVGDQFKIETPTGAEDRTVNFIEFLGGATTGIGSPVGLSDDSDVAVKVTFSDGSEAIVLATFTEDF